MLLGVLTAVLLALLGVAAFHARSGYRRLDVWRRFAAARQLGFHDGQIAGVANGFTVALLVETRGPEKNQYQVAVARCSLGDAFSPRFALEREGIADKVVQLLKGPDHQLGDPELDSTFLLHNVDGEARKLLANRVARSALLNCVERYPSMRIGNGALQLELRPPPSDEAKLSALLHDAVSLATALQAARQRD